MKESDFIGQMVHETIEAENSGRSELLSFRPDVDIDLYLKFNEKRKCYMLKHKSKILELPFNWGPLKNRISKEIIIDVNEDKWHLIEVFNLYFGTDYKSMKLNLDISTENFQRSGAA